MRQLRAEIHEKLESIHLTKEAPLNRKISFWDVMPYEIELDNGRVYAQCRLRLNMNADFWMFVARRYYRDEKVHLICDVVIAKSSGKHRAVKHEWVRTINVADCPAYIKQPDRVARVMRLKHDKVSTLVDKYAYFSASLIKPSRLKIPVDPITQTTRPPKKHSPIGVMSPRSKTKSIYKSALLPRTIRRRGKHALLSTASMPPSKAIKLRYPDLNKTPYNTSDNSGSKPDTEDPPVVHLSSDDEEDWGSDDESYEERHKKNEAEIPERPRSPVKRYKAIKLSQIKQESRRQENKELHTLSSFLEKTALKTPPNSSQAPNLEA